MATIPELAILARDPEEDFRGLRDKMMGTPTMRGDEPSQNLQWGITASSFISDVETHASVASAGYYCRYFLQYFDSLFRSMAEIDRVLTTEGKCAIVIQDSYYKELHLDLPKVVSEMASGFGWSMITRKNFPVGAAYAMMNPASRRYRTSYKATESFILFDT